MGSRSSLILSVVREKPNIQSLMNFKSTPSNFQPKTRSSSNRTSSARPSIQFSVSYPKLSFFSSCDSPTCISWSLPFSCLSKSYRLWTHLPHGHRWSLWLLFLWSGRGTRIFRGIDLTKNLIMTRQTCLEMASGTPKWFGEIFWSEISSKYKINSSSPRI